MIPVFVARPPFELTPNFSIFVEREIPGFRLDPDTGNEMPNTFTTELKAVMIRASDAEAQFRQPGGKTESIEVRGFIVEGEIPLPPGTHRAIIRGSANSLDQPGEIDILPTATPFLDEVTTSIGIPFSGFFRRLE